MFDCKKVKWTINSFKPHKSPGPDQIFPALLQKGLKTLLPTLVLMFRTSYALGYLPEAWREVKVVYIPKAGKKDPEQSCTQDRKHYKIQRGGISCVH
jgi:hypothetical protein